MGLEDGFAHAEEEVGKFVGAKELQCQIAIRIARIVYGVALLLLVGIPR